jgi:hypothetical protein
MSTASFYPVSATSCTLRRFFYVANPVFSPFSFPSSGQEPENFKHWPMVPPISLATTFKQPTPGETMGYEYSRGGETQGVPGQAKIHGEKK